jgi:trans-2,3-dihydro-3-hydroxyanthranilate isomerase
MSEKRAGGKRYVIHVVDVFTDKPLAGNQLAVVLDAEGIPGEVMQRIAKEMNISETVFVLHQHPSRVCARRRHTIVNPGRRVGGRAGRRLVATNR